MVREISNKLQLTILRDSKRPSPVGKVPSLCEADEENPCIAYVCAFLLSERTKPLMKYATHLLSPTLLIHHYRGPPSPLGKVKVNERIKAATVVGTGVLDGPRSPPHNAGDAGMRVAF